MATTWVMLCAIVLGAADKPAALTKAEEHLARGRYAEAVEAFEALTDLPADWRVRAIQGHVDALWSQGQRDQAEAILTKGLEANPESARLLALQGRTHWQRGRLDEAVKSVDLALAKDADEPLAHLIQAHVWTETGRIKEAFDGYRWFVRYYNRVQPTDAETLLLVAEGASQYARWQSVKQIFDFTLNTLCVDALKDDPNAWQSHAIGGQLLLEKFNPAQALPELQKALAINPQAVDVHLLLAQSQLQELQAERAETHVTRALEIAPHHPWALRLKAEIAFQQGRMDEAVRLAAESHAVWPTSQETLALQAFLILQQTDDIAPQQFRELLGRIGDPEKLADSTEFERLLKGLAQRNARPGYFLNELGRLLDNQRKFALAEACYQQAIVSMPQLSQPKSELGMLYLRTGRMTDARQLLDTAFKADPYHLRISNLRKVLKVLDGYETITTPHFVIQADSKLDGLLARYMAEYLEEVYAELVAKYGFEPPAQTRIEIYNKAQGLAGHQWFSARMVGLPWIQTIGASTGLLIAMTSPSATPEPFNWARVLRHEFVHVLTLQQTEFNIPHWYTEALATREEGYPPPAAWDKLLAERVPQGQFRTLDTLHLGFQRAADKNEWDFSYCQSVLYADYFEQRFGKDALPKLLNAYRGTRSTSLALQQAFGASQADVEAGYREFLFQRSSDIRTADPEPDVTPEELAAAYAENPKDPDIAGAWALKQFDQGKREEGATLAKQVLEQSPGQIAATVVILQVILQENGPLEEALDLALAAYNPEQPHKRLWLTRGQLLLKAGKNAEAALAFATGAQHFPRDPVWLKGLAEAAAASGDAATHVATLEQLVLLSADDLAPRKELAELAEKDGDHARAVKYGVLALHVNVLDADVHALLARSYRGLKNWPRAQAEYEAILELSPGRDDVNVELCEMLLDLGKTEGIRARLQPIIQRNPDDPHLKRVLKRLDAPK